MKDDLSVSLSYEQKKQLIESHHLDSKVYEYLKNRLNKLYIKIGSSDDSPIMELMIKEKLLGWCWQTTESAIVFFNDYDYIERGQLYIDENNNKYYHSWIRFKFEGNEYIFDPCLNIICTVSDFIILFKPHVMGIVSAKIVRKDLVEQIRNYIPDNREYEYADKIFKSLNITPDRDFINYINEKKAEAKMKPKTDNPWEPLFRNNVGYKSEIEDDEIKELTAHYYQKIK